MGFNQQNAAFNGIYPLVNVHKKLLKMAQSAWWIFPQLRKRFTRRFFQIGNMVESLVATASEGQKPLAKSLFAASVFLDESMLSKISGYLPLISCICSKKSQLNRLPQNGWWFYIHYPLIKSQC